MTLHLSHELTETQLQDNYDYFIQFVKDHFSGDRQAGLLEMYKEENLGMQLATAPASGRVHFHYAHTGGYIQHVLHVEKASRGVQKLYETLGGTVDYTDDERLMAVLHHDLGKLGDETGPYYVPGTSEWNRKNKGEAFTFNHDNQYWRVTDRALYNLQHYGVKVTWKEMLGIKLSDGMYDDGAQFYLKTFDPDKNLKTNLPYVVHAADMLACHAESDEWLRLNNQSTGITL